MTDTVPAFFNDRLTSGVYADIADNIRKFGDTFLGAAEYNKHFRRHSVRFPSHYSYKSADGAKEFNVILFGEIASAQLGTIVSAAGNHNFEGPDNVIQYITDASKPRDVVAIQVPTGAPPVVRVMFNNQLATLGDIRAFDEEEEIKAGQRPYVKEFVRSSNPDAENVVGDIFNVHLPVKYEKPATATAATMLKRLKKQDLDAPEIADMPVTQPPTDGTFPTAGTDFPVPTGEAIKVGAYYDPRLLYDFRGPAFKLVHNRLVQHDFRDLDDNLIPPWNYYDELRPGTVVLIQATMHCFRFNVNGRRERKLYQIHANRLCVLAKSELPVELRPVPNIPAHLQAPTPTPSPVAESAGDASSAFADFRKRKLNAIIKDDKEKNNKKPKNDEHEKTKVNENEKRKKEDDENKGKKVEHDEPVVGPSKGRRARKAVAATDDMECDE